MDAAATDRAPRDVAGARANPVVREHGIASEAFFRHGIGSGRGAWIGGENGS
jgi:hypothetical protein